MSSPSPRSKTILPRVQWTAENDNRLFLLILATQPTTVDVARVAPLFGASENAITMRMFKLRQKAKELLEELEASSDEESEESSESEVDSPVTFGPQGRSCKLPAKLGADPRILLTLEVDGGAIPVVTGAGAGAKRSGGHLPNPRNQKNLRITPPTPGMPNATLEKDDEGNTTVIMPWKPMAFEASSSSVDEPSAEPVDLAVPTINQMKPVLPAQLFDPASPLPYDPAGTSYISDGHVQQDYQEGRPVIRFNVTMDEASVQALLAQDFFDSEEAAYLQQLFGESVSESD
ncbi:MAG: hypothetical protein M1816_000748 [Peltula sp. TS41687]|nr:MAG: hypothetical protein M1816_000748 [Peltula sp. TS41687]